MAFSMQLSRKATVSCKAAKVRALCASCDQRRALHASAPARRAISSIGQRFTAAGGRVRARGCPYLGLCSISLVSSPVLSLSPLLALPRIAHHHHHRIVISTVDQEGRARQGERDRPWRARLGEGFASEAERERRDFWEMLAFCLRCRPDRRGNRSFLTPIAPFRAPLPSRGGGSWGQGGGGVAPAHLSLRPKARPP